MNVSDWFERRTRDDGKSFYTLRDDRPEWLQEAVYEAHGDTMPDDWVYEECYSAACAIDDGSLSDDDDVHEHADGRVDIYTKDRYRWAQEFCLTSLYADAEEEANGIVGRESDTTERLGVIQYCAIERITRIILQAVQENADEPDEDSVVTETSPSS